MVRLWLDPSDSGQGPLGDLGAPRPHRRGYHPVLHPGEQVDPRVPPGPGLVASLRLLLGLPALVRRRPVCGDDPAPGSDRVRGDHPGSRRPAPPALTGDRLGAGGLVGGPADQLRRPLRGPPLRAASGAGGGPDRTCLDRPPHACRSVRGAARVHAPDAQRGRHCPGGLGSRLDRLRGASAPAGHSDGAPEAAWRGRDPAAGHRGRDGRRGREFTPRGLRSPVQRSC